MKNNSRGALILSTTFIVISLLWFFVFDNIALGVIWLFMGIIELLFALMK